MNSKQLSKKYIGILKRTPNLLEDLSYKRIARKARAGLWIKMSIFLEERALNLLEKRAKLRDKGIKLFKWSYKEKEYPMSSASKIFYFYNLYKRK